MCMNEWTTEATEMICLAMTRGYQTSAKKVQPVLGSLWEVIAGVVEVKAKHNMVALFQKRESDYYAV